MRLEQARARSDVPATSALADGDRHSGAIGVSGLPGEEDERLAREAIARAGLAPPPA